MSTASPPLNEGRVTANGVDFAYLEAGPADGPLALCLHGFPDSAWTWRFLLPALADAGFRAVAPWMRGYAPTAVPPGARYQTGALVADANGLHEALGGSGDAVIVGHDWGAMATYGAAAHQPDRWRKVVTMAVPPASVVAQGFLNYDQLRRSWYMFFFQSPLIDFAVANDDLEFITRLWRDWSPGHRDNAFDLEKTKDALRDPANLAAALGYYRAMLSAVGVDPALSAEQAATSLPTPQPLLYLHGQDDGCMGAELAERHPGAVIVAGTGHFLHVEQPDVVNKHVVDFLTS